MEAKKFGPHGREDLLIGAIEEFPGGNVMQSNVDETPPAGHRLIALEGFVRKLRDEGTLGVRHVDTVGVAEETRRSLEGYVDGA